jgi:hypothetical protein
MGDGQPVHAQASACSEACVRPRRGSRVEHCKSCHQSFAGTRAGDMHRTGKYSVRQGPSRRRCLTPEEMDDKGMRRSARGVWASGYGRWKGSETCSGVTENRGADHAA